MTCLAEVMQGPLVAVTKVPGCHVSDLELGCVAEVIVAAAVHAVMPVPDCLRVVLWALQIFGHPEDEPQNQL